MSPAGITQKAAAAAPPAPKQSTPHPLAASTLPPVSFDDLFSKKYNEFVDNYRKNPQREELTIKDRKVIIQSNYEATDQIYFGNRQLTDREVKLRALTKVFYKVLSEEPWSERFIRAPDVERKLSKYEMHRDSVALAEKYNVSTPREAVTAAREALVEQQQSMQKNSKAIQAAYESIVTKGSVPTRPTGEARIDPGPWDDIEIIYIPGTVSAAATALLDRDTIYPISVSSVANTLQSHFCRNMSRPFEMAERFLNCTDVQELREFRQFACDMCDYCPHLLDNDNVSLLVVLLILCRSEVCKRWETNGIRMEGSTISHRKSECMKNKLGWNTTELKKPFDSFAAEFQTRVKNAYFGGSRAPRGGGQKSKGRRKSSTPATPSSPATYGLPPPWAYMPSPLPRPDPNNEFALVSTASLPESFKATLLHHSNMRSEPEAPNQALPQKFKSRRGPMNPRAEVPEVTNTSNIIRDAIPGIDVTMPDGAYNIKKKVAILVQPKAADHKADDDGEPMILSDHPIQKVSISPVHSRSAGHKAATGGEPMELNDHRTKKKPAASAQSKSAGHKAVDNGDAMDLS
ncbi:hypothetical protein E8E13_006956 [Curvularia kusanoi]|uniref:Uncharacterized protein n=1 Tax=Curvularia kusanoi TaxID=90978 RepID=A0A9P4TA73_CURKU|nr:hypothetical protein E8E13_006956 [Curvularia kusanoi]